MQRQLEVAGKDLHLGRTSMDDLKKKLEEAKKKSEEQAQFMPDEAGSAAHLNMGRGSSIKARPMVGKNQTRQSVASSFFIKLQQSGLPKGADAGQNAARQGSSVFNNAQMIQQMQQSEDAFANTVNELQADRMRLKGKDMLARLVALDSREGAFAQLSGEYQEQGRLANNKPSSTQTRAGGMSIQLNGNEKTKLEGALSSVETLKFKVKK